ncbi:beta-sandwich domain-containing protein [Bdellovibrio bacteriovorus]|uniref:beta-sandwich domain-containing protein n=1 Tax=Bdellovibrio bacteriovorus TaxID=959 RepID=UPI0021CF13CF|nr:beta-sandwich domain-containing protein [Bdellovibrio bacteriovorus]UXR66210.1 beta-sandwich domain-containing protein [Bdellovibrio bacteriovorus]
MERQWAQRILASVMVLQAPVLAAQADISPYTSGADRMTAINPYAAFEGVGRVTDITRKTGGGLYRLDLAKPLPLTALKIKSKSGKVKILSTTLVTEKQERIPVKAFGNANLADTDQPLASEALASTVPIAMIEIQAEAMGGSAALELTAISSQEAPQLVLRDDLSCSKKFDAILKEKLDVVQVWAGRAESSTPDSWQEKYASKEFTKYVADFITTLKESKSSFASTEYTLTLLNFFTERHNVSRAGSAAEQGYKSMATETFEVFLTSLQTEQTCRVVTTESLIELTLDFQKKQESSKADSRARKMYEMMVGKLAKLIPVQYRKELATKNLSFRQADGEGYKYYKQFAASKPEGLLKGAYQEMSTNAYALAEQALMKEVKEFDNEKTYQLIVEFQAKYNDPANYPQETMMKYLVILSEHSNFLRNRANQ